MTFDMSPSSPQTLAQRLVQGRLPVQEALRYSLLLAEALRKIHDSGQVHGAVSPGSIALTPAGLELLPAPGRTGMVTPYTAPEVARGRPADSRSDIFSFGTVIYELLTGRPAFQGDSPAGLAAVITGCEPPSSGSPAVDRLVAICLAKDPGARLQRIQKLILELKLLAVAVRRAEANAAQRKEATRAELEQVEARLSRTDQTVGSLGERLVALESRIAGTERWEPRVASLEHAATTAADLIEELERAIESARTAIAQTDDLVERIVEALESLENAMLQKNSD